MNDRWEIRSYANRKGVMMYQCAAALGWNESSLSRKLRGVLSPEDKKKIINAIDRVSASHGMQTMPMSDEVTDV